MVYGGETANDSRKAACIHCNIPAARNISNFDDGAHKSKIVIKFARMRP